MWRRLIWRILHTLIQPTKLHVILFVCGGKGKSESAILQFSESYASNVAPLSKVLRGFVIQWLSISVFIADKITHTQNLIRIPALLSSSWWWTGASFILTVWIGIFTVDRIICYNPITQSRTDHLSNKEIKTTRFGICFIFLIVFLLNLSIRSTVDKNLNMVLVSSYTWHGVIFFRITIGHNGSLFSLPRSSCLSPTNT